MVLNFKSLHINFSGFIDSSYDMVVKLKEEGEYDKK